MFPLRFRFGVPGASFSTSCVVARQFGAYAVRLDGLRFVNRFVPPVTGATRRWRLLAFCLKGALAVDGVATTTEHVVVAPDVVVAPQGVPSCTFESVTSDLALAAIRLPPELVIEPEVTAARMLPISHATREAFASLVDPVEESNLPRALAAGRVVIDALVADGIVTTSRFLDVESPESRSPAVRIVQAVYPLLSKLATKPMMIDLVERVGVSERQVLRDILKVQSDFDLLDRGWRQAIVRWRATAAVFLLSSPKLTLDEVVELAGYSSQTAMGRALREAGLPPPSEIRAWFVR